MPCFNILTALGHRQENDDPKGGLCIVSIFFLINDFDRQHQWLENVYRLRSRDLGQASIQK